MNERQKLLNRLEEAENALHDLNVTGAIRVVVDQNGERIEYTPTNTVRLSTYINKLKTDLGLAVKNTVPFIGFF